MPHSLRAKIKCLRYKRIITDKDCDRLCKALDNENVLDKIRAEIEQLDYTENVDYDYNDMAQTEEVHTICREEVLQIIDKYKAESEEEPPTVDAQPVIHAKWIFRSGAVYDEYICSNCNKRHIDYATNYCPNCGAKMESEE